MKAASIARVLGIVCLVLGIAGFIPLLAVPATPLDDYLTLGNAYAFVFATFPSNVTLDLLHVVLGLWGIGASFAFAAAVRYCRFATWVYAVLAVLGAVPITNTLFGTAAVYGNDVWLHALLALAAAYGGYGAGSIAPAAPEPPPAPPPPPASA